MPKSLPIQYSFAGGELSPYMEMRHDLPGRATGVRTMNNWFCRLQGPAETRDGFERIAGIAGERGKIMNFYVNAFTSFIICATIDTISIYDETGAVSENNLVTNGYFDDGGTAWTVLLDPVASVVFPGGFVAMAGGGVAAQEAQIYQDVTVVLGDPHTLGIQIIEGEDDLFVRVGSAVGLDDIYAQNTFSGGSDISIENLVSTTTSMFIQIIVPGAQDGKNIGSVTLLNTLTPPVAVTFTSPWTTFTDLLFLQEGMPPREGSMYFVTPGVIPHRLNFDQTTRAWTFEVVPFISLPAEWAAGHYPHSIAFFEGRAYYGGHTLYPEDFWASRPGAPDAATPVPYYIDMTLGENPDDAIHYTIGRKGKIQWMEGSDTLVIGTESGEFIVTSEGGIVIPGDINVRQQSSNGSAEVKAALAGNNILYVSSDREQIRTMAFEWTREAWVTKDLTFAAEHLTKNGHRILKLGYSQAPDNILWTLSFDGSLVGATYDALTQTAGFHHHESQDPFTSLTIRRYGGADELWVLVDRDGAGAEVSLERYTQGTSLDSYLHFEFEEATDELTGLGHLANRTCQVLVDGAVHPDIVVSETGTATLDYVGNHVDVGLGYTCTLVSLPRDDGIATGLARSGSSRAAYKRWNKIWARIISSWKPKINGRRPPERTAPTPMGNIEPAATEDVQISSRIWDKEGKITIEQDLPLKTTLVGFFGELDQEIIE